MIRIIDTGGLLSKAQIIILYRYASQSFKLGKFKSLEDILTSLDVAVIIESGIINRTVPPALEKAEHFWQAERDRLEREISEDESKIDDYRKARKNVEDIEAENMVWKEMPLRGLYDSDNNRIILYPEEMKQEYGGNCMDVLLISTLAHETMHAYFNRGARKSYPYVIFVEEPLAEFGMILYMSQICDSYLYWAYNDVRSKKTCYRYGAELWNQFSNGDQHILEYLEDYKIKLNNYPLPASNGPINLPQRSNQSKSPVQVAGQTIYPQWKKVFKYHPRFFYDQTTSTLGLDGDWIEKEFCDSLCGIVTYVNPGAVDCLYLGDNFTVDNDGYILGLLHHLNHSLFVEVSPFNKQYYSKGGILYNKKDNKPV